MISITDVGGEGDDVISALNMEGSGEEVEDVVDRVSRGFEAESAAAQRARSVVISPSISAILASSGSTVLDGGMQGEGERAGAVGTTRRTVLLDDRGAAGGAKKDEHAAFGFCRRHVTMRLRRLGPGTLCGTYNPDGSTTLPRGLR
jgi:hypothetical protein